MKKLLFVVLALLVVVSCAACANNAVDPETPPPPAETPAPAETPDETDNLSIPGLMQANIYHLGIMTQLELNEVQTVDLVNRLHELLETAAATDSMDTPPQDSANPIQVMAGQTALELIYSQEIELPLQGGNAPIMARRLLYSLPYIGNDGGLLYLGGEIYQEAPLGKIFDQALEDAIYDSAADQVERVSFSAGGEQVTINGQEYAYKAGNESGQEIPGALLNRMLYRGIAFYLNAYTGNVDGLKMMSTNTLMQAVAAVKEGQTTENSLGEEQVAKLNQYILADYFLPQAILAPEAREDGYVLSLQLNEFATVELIFVVDDDMPLVNALQLLMSDPTAQE